MAFHENTKVRENLTGSTTDTTFDTLITNKGLESDNWVLTELTKIYEKSGRIKQLPIFDITAGTINGTTAPQSIKDLASNRATFLCLIVLRQFDAAKTYEDTIKGQLASIETHLHVVEDTYISAAVI